MTSYSCGVCGAVGEEEGGRGRRVARAVATALLVAAVSVLAGLGALVVTLYLLIRFH